MIVMHMFLWKKISTTNLYDYYLSLCKLLPQHFRKYTVCEETLNSGNGVVPQVHITHNSLYKEVIFTPDNEVAVVNVDDVELSLYLIKVGMSPVQLHSAPIVDETEALFSSTQA